MKYILISCMLLFTACSVGYDTLDRMSDDHCDNIVYEQERIECKNNGIPSYEEYKKYQDEH